MFKQILRGGVHGASVAVKRYRVVYKPRLRSVDDPAAVALAKSKAAKVRLPQPKRQAAERVDAAAVALAKIKAAKRYHFEGGVK